MTNLLNWLNPGLWMAVLLAALATFGVGYWKGGTAGKSAIQAEWDAEKLAQLKLAQEAERENRNIESARARHVTDAQNAATVRGQALQADAGRARAQSDSLRGELAATRLQLPGLTREAVNRYADAASVVFDECQRSYQDLAGKTDGHASDALMLDQAWPK
jgi:hypothetical protein